VQGDRTYKLDELAAAAGTSPRTVRYYVQRGLIPAPAFKGKDSAYSHEHLLRLRAIRKMQDAFFPLDAIAIELERRSLEEIEKIADGTDLPQTQTAAPALLVTEPAAKAASPTTRTLQRIELAPGVELTIDEDAPLSSRRLFEKILREL